MAVLQELGITPVLNEQLKMCVTMLANSNEQVRKTQAGILSLSLMICLFTATRHQYTKRMPTPFYFSFMMCERYNCFKQFQCFVSSVLFHGVRRA